MRVCMYVYLALAETVEIRICQMYVGTLHESSVSEQEESPPSLLFLFKTKLIVYAIHSQNAALILSTPPTFSHRQIATTKYIPLNRYYSYIIYNYYSADLTCGCHGRCRKRHRVVVYRHDPILQRKISRGRATQLVPFLPTDNA